MTVWKIYDYIDSYDDDEAWPGEINFKTGLTQRLHPKRYMCHGDILNVFYLANFDGTTYSDMVLEETFSYTVNAFGNPTLREHKIYYYDTEGNKSTQYKQMDKYYDFVQGDSAGQTRRRNIINSIKEPVVGLIMATTGDNQATAFGKGVTFLTLHEPSIHMWIENPATYAIQTSLTGDSTTTWLDNAINSTIIEAVFGACWIKRDEILAANPTTIREYLLYEVNY